MSFTAVAKVCFIAQSEQECASHTIYYTPVRLRIDETAASGRSTVLYDAAKKTMTTIDFAAKSYIVAAFDATSEPLTMVFLPWPATWTPAGQEKAAGFPATKYSVTRSRAGFRLEGFAWVNADNIVVRLDMTLTGTSLKVNASYKADVLKLTVGAFNPALLDVAIPADFKKVEQ